MSTTQSEDRQGVLAGGRHPVNIGHLVMGLAFLGLAAVWSLIANDVVADDEIRWLLPVPWVLAGLGGLAALAVTGARRHATKATGWVDTPVTPTVEEPYEEPAEAAYDDTTVLPEDEGRA